MSKRVTTLITWSMLTGEVLEHNWYEYNGTWMLAKGDDNLKAGEESQLAFNEQLMQVFQAQYAKQSAQIDYLNGILKPMAANPQGMSAENLSAMRTSAADSIATQGANAKQAVAAAEAARGGGTGLPSGVEAQIDAGMAVNQAQQLSQANLGITQYNENIRQQNFWNAINGLSGNAAMMNPQSYAGEANQGTSALSGIGTAYYNSQQSGWLNAALGGLGAAAGGWASGGFKTPGCWIAEAIYGAEDLRTHVVREWLNTRFIEQPAGRVVMRFYLRFGERIAVKVRKYRILKTLLRPLFDRALSQALDKNDARH